MKNIVVMGSTGSIGIQSLDVISKNNSYKVIGLTCHSNADLLFEQTKKYSPDFVAIDVIDSSHNLFNLCEKNNIELIDASINALRGKKVEIFPDFPNGGLADFTQYNDGLRGGKVRVRAGIEKLNNKTLIINQIPFGTTTDSLIDSIVKATEKNKIKVMIGDIKTTIKKREFLFQPI